MNSDFIYLFDKAVEIHKFNEGKEREKKNI